MIFVSFVIVLLSVAFLTHPTPCESLKCYECSGNRSCGYRQSDHLVDCAGQCLSYLNEDDYDIQRCCSDSCDVEIADQMFSCSEDQCNGIDSDWKLLAMMNQTSYQRIISKRAADNQSSLFSCYDCSAHNPNCGVGEATVVQGCRACLVYQNTHDNNNVIRRCCTSGCAPSGTIGDYDGRTSYFCSSDRCNGVGAEDALINGTGSASTTATTISALSSRTTTAIFTTNITTTTNVQTSFSCYECSEPNGQQCTTTISNCPMCMVYRNDNDPTKFDRRCCWWACGSPNEVTDHNSRPTYFCNSDKCNGPGSEAILGYITTTSTATVSTTITTTKVATTVTTQPSVSRCYDCSGPDCGKEGSTVSNNCPSCMVYRNPNDQTKIERRCCWWNCGPSNTVGIHNGLETYFCAGDKCNGYGVESILNPPVTTTTTTKMTTTTTTRTTTTTTKMITTTTTRTTTTTTRTTTTAPITSVTTATTVTTQPAVSRCYDCSGPDCGKEGSTISNNCPSCMVYRNPNDQTKIERRCCWWNCGPSNTVGIHNGLETYFCAGDKCNGYGVESILSPPVTTTTTTKMTTTTTTRTITTTTKMITTTTTTTTTRATTTATTATTQPAVSRCYDCSGPDCGKEGSTISNNCPSCMAYRNPNDQTKIERRCCWWNCGPSNTVGIHNGLETYFCAGDKCNEYGVESILSPPVTTTTTTKMTITTTTRATTTTTTKVTTTATTRTTTSSVSSCTLNCQNGGTRETETGCFCYCLENTNGRECENVDCTQPDVDSETCSVENQPLCAESETFAFECLHLCGKC